MLFKVAGCTSPEREKALKKEFMDSVGAARDHDKPFPLPNMRSVSEMDFWAHRSTWEFCAEAWFGSKKIGEEWATVLVFFSNHSQWYGGGFAVAYFHRYREERVEYYSWRRCDHSFVCKGIGKCLHQYTCEKCGHSYEIDSSD